MQLTIYLSDVVYDVLKCYGRLDEVVNKILEAGAEGVIDIMNKPTVSEKRDGHYYKINITEPCYISLLEMYGTKSSRISLRRLLYWFVENEVYSELLWEPVDEWVDEHASKSFDVLMDTKQNIYKLSKLFPQYEQEISNIYDILNKIEKEAWNAQ